MGQTTTTSISEEPSENAEGVEGMDTVFNVGRPPTFAALASQSRSGFSPGLQTQVQLLSQIRKGHLYPLEPSYGEKLGLVWRLMIATAIAVAVAVIGVLLTVVAFVGGSLTPNPYVALAFLLFGFVLVATVVSAVRGGRDDAR